VQEERTLPPRGTNAKEEEEDARCSKQYIEPLLGFQKVIFNWKPVVIFEKIWQQFSLIRQLYWCYRESAAFSTCVAPWRIIGLWGA